jgi:hypothetical protein
MDFVINCECGFEARGETGEEIVSRFRAHLRVSHPALADAASGEELLARATIDGAQAERPR